MKKVLGIAVAALTVLAASVNTVMAQREGDLILNLNYQVGLPIGGFKDNMVGKTSWKGYSGDVLYHIDDQWAAGLYLGYQTYYEKADRKVYNIGSDVQKSMVLANSVSVAPFYLKGRFFPLGKKHAAIQPYVNLGAGLAIVDFQPYEGWYGSSITSGRFGAQGGVGVSIPFGRLTSAGLQIGADFNYVNYNGRFYSESGAPNVKLNALNSLGIYAGVHFPLR